MNKFYVGFWDGTTFAFYVLFAAATTIVTFYDKLLTMAW